VIAAEATVANPLALPALVISIVAGCIALASLTWNVLSWALSGPRVRVRMHVLALDDGTFDVAAYIWNKGRAPVDVVVAEVHRDGWEEFPTVPLLGVDEPGLPFRLEPGSSVVFQTKLRPEGSYYGAAWYQVQVTLANGDVRTSKRARTPQAGA
jgi:hypothetical protein